MSGVKMSDRRQDLQDAAGEGQGLWRISIHNDASIQATTGILRHCFDVYYASLWTLPATGMPCCMGCASVFNGMHPPVALVCVRAHVADPSSHFVSGICSQCSVRPNLADVVTATFKEVFPTARRIEIGAAGHG